MKGIPWFATPVVIREWQEFILQEASEEEDFLALSLLFHALAEEQHAHVLCDQAWENRQQENPAHKFREALACLSQAKNMWLWLVSWTRNQQPRKSPLQQREVLASSSTKHAERLQKLYRSVERFLLRQGWEHHRP